MIERVSQRDSKSWYPHGYIYKVPRMQLDIGDDTAISLSALELNNAETKRAASKNGSKHVEFKQHETLVYPLKAGTEGPIMPVQRKSTTSSLATQTHHFLCSQQLLRRNGEGIAMRRTERLFGVSGTGRSKLARSVHSGRGAQAAYEPRKDTVLKAFVRLIRGEDAFSAS